MTPNSDCAPSETRPQLVVRSRQLNRIKLSRELMVRLTEALSNQRRAERKPASDRMEDETSGAGKGPPSVATGPQLVGPEPAGDADSTRAAGATSSWTPNGSQVDALEWGSSVALRAPVIAAPQITKSASLSINGDDDEGQTNSCSSERGSCSCHKQNNNNNKYSTTATASRKGGSVSICGNNSSGPCHSQAGSCHLTTEGRSGAKSHLFTGAVRHRKHFPATKLPLVVDVAHVIGSNLLLGRRPASGSGNHRVCRWLCVPKASFRPTDRKRQWSGAKRRSKRRQQRQEGLASGQGYLLACHPATRGYRATSEQSRKAGRRQLIGHRLLRLRLQRAAGVEELRTKRIATTVTGLLWSSSSLALTSIGITRRQRWLHPLKSGPDTRRQMLGAQPALFAPTAHESHGSEWGVGSSRKRASLEDESSTYLKQRRKSYETEKEAESSFNEKSSVIQQTRGDLLSSVGQKPIVSSSCFVAKHGHQPQEQKQSKLEARNRVRSAGDPHSSSEPTTLKRRRREVAVVGHQDRAPATKTCETSKCDTGIRRRLARWAPELKSGPSPAVASSPLHWPFLTMLTFWLLLWNFGGPILQASASSGAGSDELSRAVLATMSTQSPLGRSKQQVSMRDDLRANSSSSYPPILNEVPATSSINGHSSIDEQQQQFGSTVEQPDILETFLQFGRIFIMGAIIVGDICGNSLVILSVCRHSKLRVTTNWFVVSLACADILVALFAMTFNSSVIISGRWLFKPWVCDFWNSCDVLASTASILHLCCISIDRYIAIMRPLDYPMKITTRRVVYALCGVWISSALLSYIPIFTGIYTTADHIKWSKENPDQCEFVVNRVYAIVSSSISFWIPCCIMVFTYYRIYREAARQEKFIYKAQNMMPAPITNHHGCNNQGGNHCGTKSQNRSKQRRSKSVAVPAGSGSGVRIVGRQQQHLKAANSGAIATTNLNSSGSIQAISASKQQLGAAAGDGRAASMLQLGAEATLPSEMEPLAKTSAGGDQATCSGSGSAQNRIVVAFDEKIEPEDDGLEDDPVDDSNSGQSTPTKRSISKMKREHKAARTLGIIMGVFILCWLPFFTWYTPMHICGHRCDGIVPRGAVTILFWIGYFNSTLNPIIYAYFNRDFRDAFKKTLQWIFCCCEDLKCLRVNRPNDNQHYNCTYRSTQEIGLVNNS